MSGKVVLVTGGSGLIGSEIIRELNASGYRSINLDLHVENDLVKGTWKCDITEPTSVDETIASIVEEFGSIDGLVNNAYPRTSDWGKPVDQIEIESWRKNVDMQMNSVFYITQRVLSHMVKQNSGSVVNIASIYGVVGNDPTLYENTGISAPAAYSAIKGGLINLTRYLASHYGQYGVRVNALSPGGIFDHQDPKFVEAYERRVPLRRMGNPNDIAPVVQFLLSDQAKYITGQNIIVDGGYTAQ